MPNSNNSSIFDKYIYPWAHECPGIFHICLIFKFFADIGYLFVGCLKSRIDSQHTGFKPVVNDEESGIQMQVLKQTTTGPDGNVKIEVIGDTPSDQLPGPSGNCSNNGNYIVIDV